LTFEEIAAVLEISPNTAASRYRYGLDKLREQLRLIYEEL
jgi:RNA polymerase sigma-70 factor (ECF subfamily)